MPRITITLSNYTYERIVRLSKEDNTSLSNTINYLIHLALQYLDEEQKRWYFVISPGGKILSSIDHPD